MIDPQLAEEAVTLLSTAAAELIEDAHPALLSRPPREPCSAPAVSLAALGRDLAALATAQEVLLRRSQDVRRAQA